MNSTVFFLILLVFLVISFFLKKTKVGKIMSLFVLVTIFSTNPETIQSIIVWGAFMALSGFVVFLNYKKTPA